MYFLSDLPWRCGRVDRMWLSILWRLDCSRDWERERACWEPRWWLECTSSIPFWEYIVQIYNTFHQTQAVKIDQASASSTAAPDFALWYHQYALKNIESVAERLGRYSPNSLQQLLSLLPDSSPPALHLGQLLPHRLSGRALLLPSFLLTLSSHPVELCPAFQ